jgi:hypothetical protein
MPQPPERYMPLQACGKGLNNETNEKETYKNS